LRSRGFGNLSGVLRVRVNVAHGEVAERKTELVPKRFSQCRNDRDGRAAIRAFEVAVLYERNWGGPPAANVITLGDWFSELVVR